MCVLAITMTGNCGWLSRYCPATATIAFAARGVTTSNVDCNAATLSKNASGSTTKLS